MSRFQNNLLLILITWAAVGGVFAQNARGAPEPIIEAVDEPAGRLRELPGGAILGGAPEMPAQYRVTRPEKVRVETVARNLTVPWALAFTADGNSLYVTERPGRLLRIDLTEAGYPVTEIHERKRSVDQGEGGVMGLAAEPGFKPDGPNNSLYLCETYQADDKIKNRIKRLYFSDSDTVKNTDNIKENMPADSYHNGCRLKFGPEGYLYATMGDAGQPSRAQRLESPGGKILRMKPDGSVPPDNPFAGEASAPLVYARGLRNPQGLAFQPETKVLYAPDHGPTGEFGVGGNDEINLIKAGNNYGWPQAIGAPGEENYRDPVLLFHEPHLPLAGADFVRVNGSYDLFVASLRGELLLRVSFDDTGAVTGLQRWFETEFFEGIYGRLRAVHTGPDGNLYLTTSNRDGRGNPLEGDDRVLRVIFK